MAALPNTRHELFAQARAKGLTIDAAYAEAGFKPNRHNASRLNTNETILRRIAELQDGAAEAVSVDLQWFIKTGQEIIKEARQDKDYPAASATFERLAKITGNWIERSATDANVVQRVFSSEPMTEEEWRRSLNGHAH